MLKPKKTTHVVPHMRSHVYVWISQRNCSLRHLQYLPLQVALVPSTKSHSSPRSMAFINSLPLASSLSSTCTHGLSPRRGYGLHVTTGRSRARLAPIALAGPVRSTETDTPRKVFIDKLKALEKVRLIVRNESGILEAVASFDGLFFATIPSGEYANLIDLKNNLDMHLLLDKVSGARFETGVARSASKATTYNVRILASDKETVALSVFLQWDKDPEDIAQHRIDAWKSLKAEYVKDDGDTFFFDE